MGEPSSSLKAAVLQAHQLCRRWDAANERLLAAAAGHCNALTMVGRQEVIEAREVEGKAAEAARRRAEAESARALSFAEEARAHLDEMGNLLAGIAAEEEAARCLVEESELDEAPAPSVGGYRGARIVDMLAAVAGALSQELLTKHMAMSGLADADERARTVALAAMQTEPWRSTEPDALPGVLARVLGHREPAT